MMLIRKGYAIGIVLLFIVSSVTPMILAYTINISQKKSFDVYPNQFYFDCYSRFEITYNNNVESTSLNETTTPSIIETENENGMQTLNDGLMNSSWPMYCHDTHHTGQSPFSTENITGIEVWRFKQESNGYIQGSPVIDKNSTIYFPGFMYFYAINPNGTEKWKVRIYYMSESALAIDETGVCYFGVSEDSGRFYAINPNGTIRWFIHLGTILSSPAIGNDRTIYVGTQDSTYPTTQGSVYAIYPNGTIKWRFQTNHVIYSSPAIGADGMVYCGCHDKNLYALYPDNGTMKWSFPTGDWVRVSPCIADDGTIYIVSLDSYLYAVNPNGTMKWKTNVGAGTSPTIGLDGTIYCGWNQLIAVNPDGSKKWVFDPGPVGEIQGGTPCHSADGTIYFGTSGGYLIAVNPDGTERWRKQLGCVIETSPMISENGTLYICSGDLEQIEPGGGFTDKGYLHAFRQQTDNTKPHTPAELSGFTSGKINKEYIYTTSTIDPERNPVSFMVDWGDDTPMAWTKDFASNETAQVFHIWSERGTYLIKVKARDTLGAETNWSEPLQIIITAPYVFIVSVRGGIGMGVVIQSNWNTTLTNLAMTISFDSEFTIRYPLEGYIEKSIQTLDANSKKIIHAWVWGRGQGKIQVSIGGDIQYYYPMMIGPFVLFDIP